MEVEKYFQRIDQSKIAPWFLAKAKQLVANCLAKGAEFYVLGDGGFRTPEAQDALYAIGRTVDLSRKHVTNAPAYTSYHNYGIALDFARDLDATKDGLQPDWNKDDYKILQTEAHALGLLSGLDFSSFPEAPHIQLPFRAGATGDMKKILLKDGIEAVWAHCLENLKASSEFKNYY